MNNIRSLLRCSVITLQKFKYPVCTALKDFKPRQHPQLRCYYSSSESHSPSESPDSFETDEFQSSESSPYLDVDFSEIAGDDPDKMKELKALQLEIDVMFQNGEEVPRKLTNERWHELLCLKSRPERVAHLRYLWVTEIRDEANRRARMLKRKEYEERKKPEPQPVRSILTTSSPLDYSLGVNTLFHRVYDSQINRCYNYKLLQAMRFGQQILIDCSYETIMTVRNLGLCARQLLLAWADNRLINNPYHLVFCNLTPNSLLMKKMHKGIPLLDNPDFPFFYTSKNYLDLYPKEKLVYLTSDANDQLEKYNPDDVYIIGGFVDKGQRQPLAKMKAKKDGLRMARFPVDKYLKWTMGVKSLTINQSLAIMNDLKNTHDWNSAFKHVPQRKITMKENAGDGSKLSDGQRNLLYDKLIQIKWKSTGTKE